MYVESLSRENSQKIDKTFDVSFSSAFFVLMRFQVLLSDGSSKAAAVFGRFEQAAAAGSTINLGDQEGGEGGKAGAGMVPWVVSPYRKRSEVLPAEVQQLEEGIWAVQQALTSCKANAKGKKGKGIRRLWVDLVPVLAGSLDHPLPISQLKGHPRVFKDSPKRFAPPDGPCVFQEARPFEIAKADLELQREVSPYGISGRHVSLQGDSLGSTLNNKAFSIPPASDRNPANCLCLPSPAALPLPPCLVPA
jgi:hypothetical protein